MTNKLARILHWLLLAAGLVWLAGAARAQTPVTGAISGPQTGSWTSSSTAGASGAAVPLQTQGYSAGLVIMTRSGTVSGGLVAFEGSDTPDNTVTDNWFSVPCSAPTTNGTTYDVTNTASIALTCNVTGYQRFRPRLAAAIQGAGTLTVKVQLASVATPPAAALNLANNAPVLSTGNTTGGGITRAYLGFGSANTAKTTGAISITQTTTGHNIYALGCSGNYATTNWASAVTDSALNTYVPIGVPATSLAAFPQANSTTQVCVPFLAVNATSATTITFTISGSSSSNATVSVMAWDIGNAIPSLATVDGWSGQGLSGVTSISTSVVTPSQANDLVIAAGCVSTGTITLPSLSGLTFDSGSQTISSGSNIASCFGGSALLGQPAGATGSFTDGSSASGSVVVVLFRSYPLTDAGLEHLAGNMMNATTSGGGASGYFGAAPAIVSNPPGWCKSNAAASGSTASSQILGVVGKAHVVTGFGYSMAADTTGPAAAGIQTFTLTDGSSGNAISSYCANVTTTPGLTACQYSSGPIVFPVTPGANITAAFGNNVAHELESVWMCGYDVSVTNVTY